MQEWRISDIRSGFYDHLKIFDELDIKISNLYFSTTDEHIFDVIGKSEAKKKVKPVGIWTIEVDEDVLFTIQRVNILYGGNIEEKDVFFIESDDLDDEEYNLAFARAVAEFEEIANEYNRNMELKDLYGYYRRAYVVFEKDEKKRPVVKWIVAEHVYYEDAISVPSPEEDIEDIRQAQCNLEYNEFDVSDIYEMSSSRWRNYEIPEHLTMVYVKADVVYTPYDGEEQVCHIDKIFDGYNEFSEKLWVLNKEIKHSNLKKRWYKVAGMDIDKMNELSEVLIMEHYFHYGLTKLNDEYKERMGNHSNDYRTFLDKQENLEDYLKVITNLLTNCDEEKIKAQFLKLRDDSQTDTTDIYQQFIENYFGNDYEIGKVYYVEIDKEDFTLSDGQDVSLVEFLDNAHYVELKKKILKKNNFNYLILHDEVFGKRSKEPVKGYMLDNVYEIDGKKYIHGWVGHILPVRVTGFHKDGTPIIKYESEWWSKR